MHRGGIAEAEGGPRRPGVPPGSARASCGGRDDPGRGAALVAGTAAAALRETSRRRAGATGVALAVAALALTTLAPTRAATPGTWERKAPLLTHHLNSALSLSGPRCGANCGKVLAAANRFRIVGDEDSDSRDAELYDPAAGWVATAQMVVGGHKMTLTLLDGSGCGVNCGKVLAVGYHDSDPTAELYDPGVERWDVVAAPSFPTATHIAHTATPLLDGGVVVVDGLGVTSLFDPTTLSWSIAGMGTRRNEGWTATLLSGAGCGAHCGKVLVAGGVKAAGGAAIASSQLFDPIGVDAATGRRGSWGPTGDLRAARSEHTATLLPDGRVLVAGGLVVENDGSSEPSLLAELWDPTAAPTGQWLQGPPMGQARSAHTATLTACGVLVAGGYQHKSAVRNQIVYTNPTELYLLAGAWVATGPLSDARLNHGAALLGDGTVLVAGGSTTDIVQDLQRGNGDARVSSTEVYTPVACTPPPTPRSPTPPPLGPPPDVPETPPPPAVEDLVPPVVTAVEPRSGPTAGGTRVAVSGARFARAAAVRFGDREISVHPCPGAVGGPTPACFTEESPTRITAYTPARARPGAVHVRVTTPAGTSGETPADLFDYVEAPAAPGGDEAPTQVGIPGPPGGTSVTPAPPGGAPAPSPSPGGASAPGGAPGGATAPGAASAPSGGPAASVGGAPSPAGALGNSALASPLAGFPPLPVAGGAGAPSPGLAGIWEEASEAAPDANYRMVRHEVGDGPDGWAVVPAGIVTLIACSVRVVSARRRGRPSCASAERGAY